MDIIEWLKVTLIDVETKFQQEPSIDLKSIYSTAIKEMIKEFKGESN